VVSRVNVSQAAAGQAEREFDFIVAQTAAANAQDFLIDLIEHPDLAALKSTKVVTEDPAFVEYSVDEEVAVDKAMRLRPELAQDRRRLEDAELQLAFARNQRLPRLDVVGGYKLTGLAGPGREIASADPNLAFPGGKVDGVPLRGRSAHNNWFGASGAHSWNAPSCTARSRRSSSRSEMPLAPCDRRSRGSRRPSDAARPKRSRSGPSRSDCGWGTPRRAKCLSNSGIWPKQNGR
jgi:hypothetical protein